MWVVSLSQQGLHARTRALSTDNRKVAALKSFSRFLHTKAYITQNPTLKLSLLRVKEPLPTFIKESELLSLLACWITTRLSILLKAGVIKIN